MGDVWESGLGAPELAAVRGVGFEPVGLVLGTAVFRFAEDEARCSYWGLASRSLEETTSRWSPFSGLVDGMYAVRLAAVDRLAAECRARGGDGVVGVTLQVRDFPSGGVEFVALGSAVRARSRVRPRRPFTSHLSGQEFARLVSSGWVPTGLAFGIGMASRHGGRRTVLQTGLSAGNQEVDSYTGVVNDVRRTARAQLTWAARKNGGEGVVLDEMELRMRNRHCSRGAKDLVVEAVLVGTSITRFGGAGPRSGVEPLTVMRLEREGEQGRGR